MSRISWLPDVLADAFRGVPGVQVEVYRGADSRGRATGFDPFHRSHGGVLNHHTGPGSFDALLRFMAETSSTAPLCHWATSRPDARGVVRVAVVCTGRANHAGRGGAGRGGTWWVPTDQGNTYLIGGEHQNDGTQEWPAKQAEVIHIGSAALLRKLGHPATRAVDHKDYAPGRKPDRHGTRLVDEQRAIAARMNEQPTPPPITVPPAKESDMDWVSLMAAAFQHKQGDPETGDLDAGNWGKVWFWGDVLIGKALRGDDPWGAYQWIKANEPALA